MKKIQISPSILSADFSQLGNEIKRLEEGGADIDQLIKTNSVNIPNIFKSKTLTFNSSTDGDLDAWLKNLNYEIVDYSNENNAISLDFINRSNDITDFNFSNYDVSKIDGSAFLVDIDENGTIDIISMFVKWLY